MAPIDQVSSNEYNSIDVFHCAIHYKLANPIAYRYV